MTQKEVLKALQELLTKTHKATDNWTRDRGCQLHGRHHCDSTCIFKHRAKVPTGYQLIRADARHTHITHLLYHIIST